MPEGDTVWRAARQLDRALTGKTLTRTDVRVPAYATWDLSGAHRGGDGLARQAPAHPHRRRPAVDPAHPPQDGGRVAHPQPGQRWPRPGHTARDRARDRRHGRGRLPARDRRDRGPRPTSPSSSAISAPTCSVADWDPTKRSAGSWTQPERTIKEALLDQRNAGRHRQHVRQRACFICGRRPGDAGRAPCPTCRGWSPAPTSCSTSTATGRSSPRPATSPADATSGSTAAAVSRADAAAPASSRPARCRRGAGAGDVPLPELPAGRLSAQRSRSLRPGWSAGRGPLRSQWNLRSDSSIATSLMLACRRAIRPLSSNCQFSLP